MSKIITIEGVIGVGKTTLARQMAERLQAEIHLEEVEENPFLPQFYSDPPRWAFQTQLFFLLSRYRQLQPLAQQSLFAETTVTDYLFAKDRIFASVNLTEEEWGLYQQVYDLLDPQIFKPDLVIFLQADVGVLLERITRRGREYEKPIRRDYLRELIEAYNRFFFHYDASPILVVQTGEIDFAHNPADFDDLMQQVGQMKQGRIYYHPRR
jgi:deoxyadenosine/deoxycytidine kinase